MITVKQIKHDTWEVQAETAQDLIKINGFIEMLKVAKSIDFESDPLRASTAESRIQFDSKLPPGMPDRYKDCIARFLSELNDL